MGARESVPWLLAVQLLLDWWPYTFGAFAVPQFDSDSPPPKQGLSPRCARGWLDCLTFFLAHDGPPVCKIWPRCFCASSQMQIELIVKYVAQQNITYPSYSESLDCYHVFRWFSSSTVLSRGVIVWLNWKRKNVLFRGTVKLRLSPVMNFALIRILQMVGCHRYSDGTLLIYGGANRNKLNEEAIYCFRCCASTRLLLSAR